MLRLNDDVMRCINEFLPQTALEYNDLKSRKFLMYRSKFNSLSLVNKRLCTIVDDSIASRLGYYVRLFFEHGTKSQSITMYCECPSKRCEFNNAVQQVQKFIDDAELWSPDCIKWTQDVGCTMQLRFKKRNCWLFPVKAKSSMLGSVHELPSILDVLFPDSDDSNDEFIDYP